MGQQSQPPRAGRPACVPSGSGGGGRCSPTTGKRTELRSVGAPESWWFRVCSVEDVEQGNRPPNPPLGMDLGPISCSLPPPGRPALPCHPFPLSLMRCPPPQFAGSDVAPPPYLALPLAQYQLCPTGLETIQRGCTVASSHVPSSVQSARLEASSLGLGRFRSHFIDLHPRPGEAGRGHMGADGLSSFLLRLPPCSCPHLGSLPPHLALGSLPEGCWQGSSPRLLAFSSFRWISGQ